MQGQYINYQANQSFGAIDGWACMYVCTQRDSQHASISMHMTVTRVVEQPFCKILKG